MGSCSRRSILSVVSSLPSSPFARVSGRHPALCPTRSPPESFSFEPLCRLPEFSQTLFTRFFMVGQRLDHCSVTAGFLCAICATHLSITSSGPQTSVRDLPWAMLRCLSRVEHPREECHRTERYPQIFIVRKGALRAVCD